MSTSFGQLRLAACSSPTNGAMSQVVDDNFAPKCDASANVASLAGSSAKHHGRHSPVCAEQDGGFNAQPQAVRIG